jgi:rhamnosyltransferase
MTANIPSKVHAIVVTFNPKRDVLLREFEMLAPQVHKIWLVDNASNQPLANWVSDLGFGSKLELVQMSSNVGLGAAQNAGITLARSTGATHVLILDQDSEPMPDMVTRLLTATDRLLSADVRVAAVAPVWADSAKGPASYFVRLGWFGFKRQNVLSGQDVVDADFVISSGSMVPTSVLDDIGPMDESLFIDHVDTEWCLRALSKGYRLFGVPSSRMVHTLGDRRERIWFLRWRNVPHHSPFRYYYILRNGILLQRRQYIPIKWRVAELFRSIRVLFFYGLFSANRLQCLQYMFKGIWDGFKGISGPYKV